MITRLPPIALEHRLTLAFVAGLVVLFSFSIVGLHSTLAVRQGAADVERTRVIVASVDALLAEVTRLEAAAGRFVFTGAPELIGLYEHAAANSALRQRELERLEAGGDPARLRRLRQLVMTRIAQATELITIRQLKGLQGSQEFVATRTGSAERDLIRSEAAAIQHRELQQLADSQAQRARSARITQASVVFGALAATVFMGGAFVLTRRESRIREAAQAASVNSAAELARAEERFRSVVEASPNAILMVDEQGVIALVNRQCEALLGYAREELVGSPVSMLAPQDAAERHHALLLRYMRAPLARQMNTARNLFARSRLGAEIPVEIGLNPVRIGDRTFVLATVLDISERRRAEEQIHQSLHEKDMLLREVHHRVKNNMQVISSMLSLQSNVVDDPDAKAMLADCQSRVRSMAMVHEKLYRSQDLASIDFGRYITDLAQTVLRSFGGLSSRVRLAVEAAPEPVSIDTAIPLGLIANELLTNALKYAFPGAEGGVIRLRFAKDGQDHFILSVADDGVGFRRPDAAQNSTSLGLRLVRSLTRQVKGELRIISEQGAEFRLRLPIARNAAAPESVRAAGGLRNG